jgi:hypothetical protein
MLFFLERSGFARGENVFGLTNREGSLVRVQWLLGETQYFRKQRGNIGISLTTVFASVKTCFPTHFFAIFQTSAQVFFPAFRLPFVPSGVDSRF